MVVAVFLLSLVFVSSSTTTALLLPPPSDDDDDDEEEESEAFNLPNNGLYVGYIINNVDFFPKQMVARGSREGEA